MRKFIKYAAILLVGAGAVGGGVYAAKYGVSEITYKKDVVAIDSAYLNYKQKSLHTNLNVKKLDDIPSNYHLIFKQKQEKVKHEYNRIRPLYKNQIYSQQGVDNLFDGQNNYVDGVTAKELTSLLKDVEKINNDTLRSKLINKIDKIDLWLTQTNQAIRVIDKVANKASVSFSDYVKVKANYSLIKNQKLKKKYKVITDKIEENYKAQQAKDGKINAANLKKAVADAKKSAKAKVPYTKSTVTINLITKSDQDITDKLNDAGIDADSVIYVSDGKLYLMQKQDKYYVSSDSFSVDGTADGQYTAKLSVNSGQNGVTDYTINKSGALITDDSDSSNAKWSVINTDDDFSTTASYIKLDDKTKLILATGSDNYVVISDKSVDDADNNLVVSSGAYSKITDFISESTVVYSDSDSNTDEE